MVCLLKVCLRDFDYWKERFETLFSENNGLIELFQKTQKHFHENGDHLNVIGEHECTNKTTSEEFHNLKLDLLVNQMEHLKLLEALKEVKSKGKQNEKRVKVLEEENHDLKKKLEEEEEDDQELELTWGNRVAELVNENEELRQTLVEDDAEDMKVLNELRSQMDSIKRENGELKTIIEHLDKQMVNGPSSTTFESDWSAEFEKSNAAEYVARYNIMRDRINQMMFENEELKGKIARYRWTAQKKDDDEKDEERHESKMKALKARISILNRQLQGEQIESRRWKEKFESIIKKMKNSQTQTTNQKRSRQESENYRKSDSDNSDNSKNNQQNKRSDEEESPRKRKWNTFRTKINKNFESFSAKSKQFFNNFVDKVKNRWSKLHRKYSKDVKSNIPLNGDKLLKIGQFLESALENVQNFSEGLLKKGMHSEMFTFLTDKVADIANLLEKNLKTRKTEEKDQEEKTLFKYATTYYHEKEEINSNEFSQESVEKEVVITDEIEEDITAFEKPPPYPSISNRKSRKDWLTERAKSREKIRQKRF